MLILFQPSRLIVPHFFPPVDGIIVMQSNAKMILDTWKGVFFLPIFTEIVHIDILWDAAENCWYVIHLKYIYIHQNYWCTVHLKYIYTHQNYQITLEPAMFPFPCTVSTVPLRVEGICWHFAYCFVADYSESILFRLLSFDQHFAYCFVLTYSKSIHFTSLLWALIQSLCLKKWKKCMQLAGHPWLKP